MVRFLLRDITVVLLSGLTGWWLAYRVANATVADAFPQSRAEFSKPPFASVPSSAEERMALPSKLTPDELLQRLAPGAHWAASSARMDQLASVSASLTNKIGLIQAIPRLRKALAEAGLSPPAREIALEVAFISAFDARKPSEDDAVRLLRSAGNALTPLLRSLPYAMESRTVADIHRQLRELLEKSGHTLDAKTQNLLISVSVATAAHPSAQALLDFAKGDGMSDMDGSALIAAAASRIEPRLAFDFIVRQAMTDVPQMAKLVRRLQLSGDLLKSFFSILPSEQRSAFVTQYLEQSKGQSLKYALDLSEAISAADLSPAARALMVGELLRSGGGRVSSWMESLPMPDRLAALADTYKSFGKPGYVARRSELSKEWLSSASGVDGLDDKLLGTAIGNALPSLSLEKALSYINRLSEESQPGMRKSAYAAEAHRHLSQGVDGVMRFIQSVPEELQQELLVGAAGTFLLRYPADGLRMYREATDPAVKKQLEDTMLSISQFDGVSQDQKAAWIQERLKDPKYLKREFAGLDSYLEELRATNPSGAAQFASSLPESPMKNSAVRNLASSWSYADPASASEWIVKLPAGPARDGALLELIAASRDEPQLSFINATGIRNNKLRLEAASSVVNWWKDKDPEVIRKLLAESALPQNDKQRLLDLIQKK